MLDKTVAMMHFLRNGGEVPITLESFTAAMTLVAAAEEEVKTLRSLPEIVCLCGSTRFIDIFIEKNRQFTMQGKIVLGPGVFGKELTDDGKDTLAHVVNDDEKTMLDALHFRKIDLANAVYVINKAGYIGTSTHNEVVYAVRTEKIVVFMESHILTKKGDRISAAHYLKSIEQTLKMEVSR